MFTPDYSNEWFQLATNFVQHTRQSVFLTGKAGTGKTTFLKYIKEHSGKQSVVLAPTGVAAINAGGATVHSFFHLPFAPFVPANKGYGAGNLTDKHQLISRLRFNAEKKELLNSLELLIIDEISMVRCDVLDAIDTILRYFRNKPAMPFGGVQVLLIGDMYQLPPVIPDSEWNLLSSFYASPYFFDSYVMKQEPPVYIELDKIYRQNEQQFIDLLNKVRNNQVDASAIALLKTRYQPEAEISNHTDTIILTTHNIKADNINSTALNNLVGKATTYLAAITGDFSEKAYPADERLVLKEGAQVMFIKNDLEKERRFFNGKIGVVHQLEEDTVTIACTDEVIELKKHKWENIRYSYNKGSSKIEEEVLGTFEQFPLRLAWAITIHKSQGLTFEKAIIDAGAAFAPGQVYVALSRCTTLDGIILTSPISSASLHADDRIVAFSKNKQHSTFVQQQLEAAAIIYQQDLLKSIFDFSVIAGKGSIVFKLIYENAAALHEGGEEWARHAEQQLETITSVGQKFNRQLEQLLQPNIMPGNDNTLIERVMAAANYFHAPCKEFVSSIEQCPVATDGYLLAVQINAALEELYKPAYALLPLLALCKTGFDADALQQKKNALKTPLLKVNTYAVFSNKTSSTNHPELYAALRKTRDRICAGTSLPIYRVASTKTLEEMVQYLPQDPVALEKINGFGPAKIKQFGSDFLKVIADYCKQHQLNAPQDLLPAKKARAVKTGGTRTTKPDTKQETLRLFKEGKAIEEIATIRNLTNGTIETHLAAFIKTGELLIETFLAAKKIDIILSLLNEEAASLNSIKEKAGSDISFGEIRWVLAHKEYIARQQTTI